MNETQDFNRVQIIRRFRGLTIAALSILGIGTVFYHWVEKLSWVDSLYFCTVTLTTIGYGDIAPKTTPGKLFTVFYVLVGIGIVAAFANQALKSAVARRARNRNDQ